MRKVALVLFLACFAVILHACGGGASPSPNGSGGTGGGTGTGQSFTISGTVTGLSGKGLKLKNGSETLPVAASGAFTFAKPVASGATYDVTIATQPSMPSQTCTVTDGSGTATANVTNVTVTCSAATFTIGGTVIGLAGTGLVLQDNNADNLGVIGNGAFVFATPVASGGAFSVTVMTQPTGPTQNCVVVGGTGTVASANVTDVMVNCGTTDFVIGGTITGLGGGSVVLQDNGGDDLTVTANGTFAFATPVASGATYTVTVLTQPSSPPQTCTVTMGSGTVGSANVTSVDVACAIDSYTIGGTVSGLAGMGLVLEDNGGDDLTVSADGAFTFATPVASGQTYAVTVQNQPTGPTQTCAVTMGSGTVASANVTSVAVTCTTSTYTIGGTITGLAASDSVVLQDNGGDNLTVSANGPFTFATSVASGATFAVTVFTEPGAPAQTCTVSGGTGTVVAGNVTSVTVNCATNKYTIGGTVTGLASTLVLQDNGGDNLSLSMNGTFAFATPIASGLPYAVTVLTQPGAPSQTCVVTKGSGNVASANVTNVTVVCTTNKFTVGGTVTGLAPGDTVVLQDNGADNLTVNASGAFTFATSITSGATYNVTIQSKSGVTAQTCTVSGGTGTVGGANVTSVAINCTTNKYTIGGTVSGLSGTGLVLQDNGGDNLSISANGAFAFATPIASDATYSVTVLTNPTLPSQTCVVTSGGGTVGAANVTTVTVACTINTYTIGGTLSGLAAGDSTVLQDNGGNNLTVSANGAFTFTTSIASGGTYAVSVLTQPPYPCVVTSGTGSVTNANITSVVVTCAPTQCSNINGVRWCMDTVGGRTCDTFCTALGFGDPAIAAATWLAAQDTQPLCTQIGAAFGLTFGSIASYTYACAEASGGTILCSSYSGCPANHLTGTDGASFTAICPCM